MKQWSSDIYYLLQLLLEQALLLLTLTNLSHFTIFISLMFSVLSKCQWAIVKTIGTEIASVYSVKAQN